MERREQNKWKCMAKAFSLLLAIGLAFGHSQVAGAEGIVPYKDVRVEKCYSYNEDGGITETSIYRYDRAGNRISIETLDESGKMVSKKICIYNEDNLLTDTSWYNGKNVKLKEQVIHYDEEGRITE